MSSRSSDVMRVVVVVVDDGVVVVVKEVEVWVETLLGWECDA